MNEKFEKMTKKEYFAWYRKHTGKLSGKARAEAEDMAQRFYWHDILEELWEERPAVREWMPREILDQMTWDEAWFMLLGQGYDGPDTCVKMESSSFTLHNFVSKHDNAITAEYDKKTDKVRARYVIRSGDKELVHHTPWFATTNYLDITDRAPGIEGYMRLRCDVYAGRKTREDLKQYEILQELKYIRRQEVEEEWMDKGWYTPLDPMPNICTRMYEQVEQEFQDPKFVAAFKKRVNQSKFCPENAYYGYAED